ncbi:aryl hydrocarbon receptor-like [Ambystoma mexicanum]|uniref:aryl hydrocarbon receptor-like n=1 Tax=Ambystoma mexicanum TaxID=8296 RepID=UPI0037E9AE29
MYTGRKRRKPLQRTAKPPPVQVVKSNPSKRHRDRLNQELERLATLLPFPEEVTSSLDKLSILRLSVSYLRTKSFFHVALKTNGSKRDAEDSRCHDNQRAWGLADRIMPEGELLLQALNGFVLVVTAEGLIFYSSHTIQEYLGFNQTDVMHQSVFELIHTEDQQEFRRNLHWALNPPALPERDQSPDGEKVVNSSVVAYKPEQLPPENSAFLERSFVCRFRCLLGNSSGFLALNLQGRLKYLHGQNQRSKDGSLVPPQPALFAILTPLQSPSILEIRTKNMIFRTKHKLDFTPTACDAKGKVVLGYTETELRMRGTGYQFIHAADMIYCAENHVRMMKTGESGLTVFRLLTKENQWKWVQANARLVYKNGKPDYIIATQRPLVEEEGGEHLRNRSMHLPFTFATGEALLYQISNPILGLPDPFQSKGKSKARKSTQSKGSRTHRECVDPKSLLGAMMRQDESVYVSLPAATPKPSFSSNLSHLSDPGWTSTKEGCNVAPPSGNGLKPELSGLAPEDPLLSTLDSLSIDSEDNCSNNDLFTALESLGLNAEDLELLLLDERLMTVETDPESAPSLNVLLTNNEILSYVHSSLVNGHNQENAGDQQVYAPVSNVETSNRTEMQVEHTQYYPQPLDQMQPQLILQLPQQMQQYSITHKQQNGHFGNQMRPTSQSPSFPGLNRFSDYVAQHRPSASWTQEAELIEGLTLNMANHSKGGQPEVSQWIRCNGMSVSASNHKLSSEIPYQNHQKQDKFQSAHQSFQSAHSRLQLPHQCQTEITEAQLSQWGQLQQKNSQNALTNGLCNYSHSNPIVLESSLLPSYLHDVPEHIPGLSSWKGASVDQNGLSFKSQLRSAQTHSAEVSTIHFYLNGLSNMEVVDTAGIPECRTQLTGCAPPSYPLISVTQPLPIPLDTQCSFKTSTLEHLVDIENHLETTVSPYGGSSSQLMESLVYKPGNGCVLTGPLPGFPEPSLLPKGNSTALSEELPCHQEGLPAHSNLQRNGYYR